MTILRLGAVALVLALVACDSAGDGTDQTLEGPLVLRIADLHEVGGEPAPPRPTLLVATDSIYPCVNFRLDVNVRPTPAAIDVTVRGVEPTDVCLTALGPATARIPLDVPDGDYRLRIRHDGETDEWDFRLGAERIEIDSVRASVTRAPDPLAWRVPERSFAYLCGTFTGEEDLCDRFRARFEPLTAGEIDVPEAGVWPYPRAASGHYYDAPGRVYRYASEADFEAVKDSLRVFSHQVLRERSGDGLSVTNWRGDVGYSWVYEAE